MKMKTSIFTILFLSTLSSLFGQMNGYEFKREIGQIKDQWNAIELPDNIYNKVNLDLSDIRIYGITSKKDTIEAPYIFAKNEETLSETDVEFKLINQSKNDKGYYFTFQSPSENVINQLIMNFEQTNFDWRIKLEGSQNQLNWFTIVDNYRILSIKNSLTNYQFNKISFPNSKYSYYRVCISANEKPRLKSAKMTLFETNHGFLKKYNIKHKQTTEDKKRKQTVIDLELEMSVPVNKIKIGVKDKMDYYRPILIEYLTDSFKTDKSWYFDYEQLESASTLSSIDKQEFNVSHCISNRLRITIDNYDNQPLKFDSFQIFGYQTILITRIIEPASYFLCYGKKDSQKPNYDIEQFSSKISSIAAKTLLNKEEFINPNKAVKEPLFINKAWLWGIMTLIILLLGWFTLKMMKKVE